MSSLAAIAALLAKEGAGDLVKGLAKPAVVALIAKVTGVNINDPNFGEVAADRLKNTELRNKLITELRTMDLESQRIAVNAELQMLSSGDKLVRYTRPITQMVFVVLISSCVLSGIWALLQDMSFQKDLYAKCNSMSAGFTECFSAVNNRKTFVSIALILFASPLMMMAMAGAMGFINWYNQKRSQEKIAGKDATISAPRPKPPLMKRIKERARLPRRVPTGTKR